MEPTAGGMLPSGYGRLRAADADRERAIDVLKAAFAEGRLDKYEYTERVGQVHSSRSYAELAELTVDLPAGPLGTMPPESWSHQSHPAIAGPSTRTSALAVVSLILGIASAVFPSIPVSFLVGFAAALLGLIALVRIAWTEQRGIWLAIASIVIGVFGYFGGISNWPGQ